MKPVSQWDPAQLSDLIFDAFYASAIGGSAVALYFLFVDTLAGAPLLTPSILGGSLFMGADPTQVTSVRMDAVVLYTAFHLFACCVLGGAVALVVHTIEYYRWNSARVMFATFALLQVVFLAFASLTMPAVVERIGLGQIALGNLFAATSVTVFLRASRNWRAAKAVN
jgi:hypothetical protein